MEMVESHGHVVRVIHSADGYRELQALLFNLVFSKTLSGSPKMKIHLKRAKDLSRICPAPSSSQEILKSSGAEPNVQWEGARQSFL